MGVVANIKGPKGDNGAQGDTGPQGVAGVPGSKWYNGTSAPADTLGVDGDYYLNTATGDVYAKAGGTWA